VIWDIWIEDWGAGQKKLGFGTSDALNDKKLVMNDCDVRDYWQAACDMFSLIYRMSVMSKAGYVKSFRRFES
jgi:hypothetical protein